MQMVKLCSNKILQFLTQVLANTGCLYNDCKTVVVVTREPFIAIKHETFSLPIIVYLLL